MASSSASLTHSSLPKQKVSTSAIVIHLGDILNEFDPESYEKATTTYRKPTYQRGLKKDIPWMKSLVESILKGRSIGSVVMSKWQKFRKDAEGEQYSEEWYNVEDGGTRLGALLKFKNNEFTTDWGGYDNPEIKQRFMSYKIPVVMIVKANVSSTRTRVKDREYFAELCENFGDLQEGTALSTSDRYCGFIEEPEYAYGGAPIINMTIEGISRVNKFQTCFGFSNINRRNNRKKLADAVALTSGVMWGPKYANTSYFNHVHVLAGPNSKITDGMTHKFQLIMRLFFETIETIERKFPKWKKENFTNYFSKTKLFTGLWMTEIFNAYPSEQIIEDNTRWVDFSKAFIRKWSNVVNKYRSKICTPGLEEANHSKTQADDWLEHSIYDGLAIGEKRNTNPENYVARLKKIDTWYASQLSTLPER